MLYSFKQAFARGHGRFDQLSHHLGVGVGNAGPALIGQLLSKRAVVFDNAVVNDRDALVNDMRMCINDRRLAMCRPARMGDPRTTLYRCRKLGLLEC